MGVYKLLEDENLSEFYEKRGERLLDKNDLEKDIDLLSFQGLASFDEDGFLQSSFVIDRIHCSACIWLIEKALKKLPGILDLDLNQTTHKISITLDLKQTSLKDALERIISLGYLPLSYDYNRDKLIKKQKHAFASKLIVAIACMMNIMWLSIAKYSGYFFGMDEDSSDIINYAQFLLSSPVLFYTGSEFYRSAFHALKNKSLNMDCLVIFGATIVFIYSLIGMFARTKYIYFDSVTMIICFVFIGKYLEFSFRKKALDTIDLVKNLLDSDVKVLKQGELIKIALDSVKEGDEIVLHHGDKVLVDGICLSGLGLMDKSNLTGESTLLQIKPGEEVQSACVLASGQINYLASCAHKDSLLARIISLLQNTKKSRLDALVDRLSSYFAATILTLALLCFLLWLYLSGFNAALINAFCVLIIACPCALALATPICSVLALHQGFRERILFKDSANLEKLAKCKKALLDKTGVLSLSKLEILEAQNFAKRSELGILAEALNKSSHPIALAVKGFLAEENPDENTGQIPGESIELIDFKELPGKGFSAIYKGQILLAGSFAFLGIEEKTPESNFAAKLGSKLLLKISFKASLNPEAMDFIKGLKKLKIKPLVLSGDNENAVSLACQKLGIKDFKHSLLPQDKLDIVKAQTLPVFMAGDGVNDALALRAAHVGISLKNASSLAIESSDLLIMDSKLSTLLRAIKLARRANALIRQNLAFSLLYNCATLFLAFCGLLNPLIASVSMSFSSLVVLLNSLRILR